MQLILGRPWTAEELRRKSFEDLHVLWYKCLLEKNIIATEAQDARRQGVSFAIEGIQANRISTVIDVLTGLSVGQTNNAEDKVCVVGKISCLVGSS